MTEDESEPETEDSTDSTSGRGFGEMVRHLADEAGVGFAAAAVLIPLVLTVGGFVASTRLLTFTHVGLGAFWFGAVLFLVGVLSPSLDAAGPQAAGKVSGAMTPKNFWILNSLATFTLVSGHLLAVETGYFAGGPATPLVTAAYVVGILMWINGTAFASRYTTLMYFESVDGKPDPDRMASLKQKNTYSGVVQIVLAVAIIVLMTQFGFGI